MNNVVNLIYVFWCLLGWYSNSKYGPRYDENDYVRGAGLLLNGNWDAYSHGANGTLNRPYAYPLFLAGVSIVYEYINELFVFTKPIEFRSLVTLVQAFLFWRATKFLATSLQKTSHVLATGVPLGLLGQPFIAFMMSDMLSDALSVISWVGLSGLIIRQGNQHRANRVFEVGAMGFVSAWLVMVRSANLPSMALWVALYQYRVVLDSFFRRGALLSVRIVLQKLAPSIALWLGIALASSLQVVAMIDHLESVGNNGQFWGAGSAATSFGLKMAKYTTAVNTCGGMVPAAVAYGNPLGGTFVEEEMFDSGFMGLGLYYIQNIWYMLLHLFNGVNYDFPTTYIMSWNWKWNFGFNILSALTIGMAISGACLLRRSWERPIDIWVVPEMRWVRMVSILVFVNYAQLAIISVENRYGVVGWAWVSVAAASAGILWRERCTLRNKIKMGIGAIIVVWVIIYISMRITYLSTDIVVAYAASCV